MKRRLLLFVGLFAVAIVISVGAGCSDAKGSDDFALVRYTK